MSARVRCGCGWNARYASIALAEGFARRHVCRQEDRIRRATRRHRCARCGFVATYDNAGAAEARYWFSKHSCRKRELAMQRQKAYGRYNKYVPALAVRQHVDALTAAGMGLKQIAKVSGVANGVLWKLMYGKTQPDGSRIPSRRVLRVTAEKLYAIDPDWSGRLELADGAKDPVGTPPARAHLQSLVAMGWSMSELGRRLGVAWGGNACGLIGDTRQGGGVMQRRTVDKANALFEELCMTPPPETNQRERIAASRSRRYAREHGWPLPLELEDVDDVDEPVAADVDIDEVAVQRRMDGDTTVPLNRAERLDLVRRLNGQGLNDKEIGRRTGIHPDQVQRDRTDLGLPGIRIRAIVSRDRRKAS